MGKTVHLGHVKHQYWCNHCGKYLYYILSWDEERPKKAGCPTCLNEIKYKGGTHTSVTMNGNCGYTSYEKQTEVNWKNLDSDSKEKMLSESYSVNRQKNNEEANKGRFWRHYLPDPNKPLDLSKIKDTEKFVMTGETS